MIVYFVTYKWIDEYFPIFWTSMQVFRERLGTSKAHARAVTILEVKI